MMIRPLHTTDIDAVAALLHALALSYIVNESTPEAAAGFIRENNADGIRAYIEAGMAYHVAEKDGKIAGFIAIRDNKHLFHMFVDPAWHRQGIASALWNSAREAALQAGNPGVFTVNASNYALPVYQKLGFVQTEATQCKAGLYFNPMQLDGSDCD
jgi:GNAT superfamily N-acetyltransferase